MRSQYNALKKRNLVGEHIDEDTLPSRIVMIFKKGRYKRPKGTASPSSLAAAAQNVIPSNYEGISRNTSREIEGTW